MRSRGLSLAAMAVVFACSGSGDDAEAKACSSYASNLCARFNACAPVYVEVVFGDAETCTSRQKLTCGPKFGAAGTGATASNLSACADAVDAVSCDDLLDGNLPAACTGIHGSLSVGSGCVAGGVQCPVGTYCNVQPDQNCGVCESSMPEGQVCETQTQCASGLTCAANTCGALVDMGGACDPGHQCKATLTCRAGTCAARLGLGETCVTKTDCDSAHGLYCNTQTLVCDAVMLAPVGQPCGDLPSGKTQCLASSCITPSNGTTGTCEAYAADGGSCGTAASPTTCLTPAACVQGTCTLPDPSACH